MIRLLLCTRLATVIREHVLTIILILILPSPFVPGKLLGVEQCNSQHGTGELVTSPNPWN